MQVTPINQHTTTRPTGIVPPWLMQDETQPTQPRDRNPGIVPPWLQHPGLVRPEQPVDPDAPRILGAAAPTVYDPRPVDPEPDLPRILAAR